MYHKLKDGAIFIADSHYPNHKKEEFLEFLEAVDNSKIKTSQLIFMGDNFDLLVGGSKYLIDIFAKEIDLINNIAKKIEILYIEGNHDFNLKSVFRSIDVFSFEQQPLILTYKDKTYGISHGDKFAQTKSYYIYTKIIRNPFILKFIPDSIARYMLYKMRDKKICKKIKNFKRKVDKISSFYKTDFIIEGHFHQGQKIDSYISLPSFACSNKVAVFNDGEFDFKLFDHL